MGRKEVWRKLQNEELRGMKLSESRVTSWGVGGGMKGGKFLSIIFYLRIVLLLVTELKKFKQKIRVGMRERSE